MTLILCGLLVIIIALLWKWEQADKQIASLRAIINRRLVVKSKPYLRSGFGLRKTLDDFSRRPLPSSPGEKKGASVVSGAKGERYIDLGMHECYRMYLLPSDNGYSPRIKVMRDAACRILSSSVDIMRQKEYSVVPNHIMQVAWDRAYQLKLLGSCGPSSSYTNQDTVKADSRFPLPGERELGTWTDKNMEVWMLYYHPENEVLRAHRSWDDGGSYVRSIIIVHQQYGNYYKDHSDQSTKALGVAYKAAIEQGFYKPSAVEKEPQSVDLGEVTLRGTKYIGRYIGQSISVHAKGGNSHYSRSITFIQALGAVNILANHKNDALVAIPVFYNRAVERGLVQKPSTKVSPNTVSSRMI